MESSGGNTPDEFRVITQLTELNHKIERLLEGYQRVAEDVTKIKGAVYNPEKGIYSRLRDVETSVIESGQLRLSAVESELVKNGEVRMSHIEAAIGNIKKLVWILITTVFSGIAGGIIKMMFFPSGG